MAAKIAGDVVAVDPTATYATSAGFGCVVSAGSVSLVPSGGTAGTYPDGWAVGLNAADVAGSDGAAVSSWAGGLTFAQATAGARPTLRLAGNGINGRPCVRFGGGKYMTSATGAASLGSDWYVAAVVRPVTLSAFQWFVMWGDEATGKRRGCGLTNANYWSFNGYSADVTGQTLAATNTAYLVEFRRQAGVISAWVNGVPVFGGSPSLAAFASAAVTLGANNAGGENWLGDIARLYVKSSVATAAEVSALRLAAAAEYGLTVAGQKSPLSVGDLGCGLITASSEWIPDAEHELVSRSTSDFLGRNVLRLQQKSSIGYSCVYGCSHDTPDGSEGTGFAVGWGNSGCPAPFASSVYLESYNSGSATFYPLRLIQTSSTGFFRRVEIEATSGDFVVYRRAAVFPGEVEAFRVKATGQVRYQPLASDPAGAEAGDVYFNSTTNKLKVRTASSWETVTSA